MNRIAMTMVAASTAVLAACGGGGGDSGAAPGGGTQGVAPECTASQTLAYGSKGGIFTIEAGTTVIEMTNTSQAVADGAHTVQATALTPGQTSLALYTLQNGQCSNATAQTALAEGTASLTSGEPSSAQQRLFLVLQATGRARVQMCGYAGATAHACDPDNTVVAGVVTDSAGHPLAGANVDVTNNGQTTTAVTDDQGQFSIQTPTGTLPGSYVVDVSDGEHVPVGVPVTQSPDGVDTVGDVTLTDASDGAAPLESRPTIHHLGDSQFAGTENSQLQSPDAEGLLHPYTFTLTAAQVGRASATLDFVAKAVNCADEVSFNGRLVGTLSPSPADGSYGSQHLAVPSALLLAGANTATITSVACGGGGDYDDFEYSVPVLNFH